VPALCRDRRLGLISNRLSEIANRVNLLGLADAHHEQGDWAAADPIKLSHQAVL
jgi:hypothetical protein